MLDTNSTLRLMKLCLVGGFWLVVGVGFMKLWLGRDRKRQ